LHALSDHVLLDVVNNSSCTSAASSSSA